MMSKNKALKVVNVLLAVLIVNQMAVPLLNGIVISVSPPDFEWLHKRAAWLLMAMVIAHVILNWNWIKANYFKRKKG